MVLGLSVITRFRLEERSVNVSLEGIIAYRGEPVMETVSAITELVFVNANTIIHEITIFLSRILLLHSQLYEKNLLYYKYTCFIWHYAMIKVTLLIT